MNRQNLISGGIVLLSALLAPAIFAAFDEFMGMMVGIFVSPILVIVGLILLLTGLFGREGGARGQQQQQMVVVHTGPTTVQLRCPGCGQMSGTDARFCAGCGGRLA